MGARRKIFLFVALGLIVEGILGVYAGSVSYLSILLVPLAPTAVLAGVALLIALLIPTSSVIVRALVAVVLVVLLGANTRLQSFRPPQAHSAPPELQRVSVRPEQWIKLETNVETLQGREQLFDGPRPRCNDAYFCVTSNGFRQPQPGVIGEYWDEPVRMTVMQRGLALSGTGEPVATLRVMQRFLDSGRTAYAVRFELLDAAGKLLAERSSEQRTGLAFESPDGSAASALEYLLHGNVISDLLGTWGGYAENYPLHLFLDSTLRVSKPEFPRTKVIELDSKDIRTAPDPAGAAWISLRSACGEHVSVQPLPRDGSRATFDMRSGRVSSWSYDPNLNPVQIVRNERGALFAFTQQSALLLCTDAALYSLSRNIPATGTARLQSFRLDGTPDFELVIQLGATPATVDHFEVAGSKIRFLRRLSTAGSQAAAAPEPIEVDIL